MPTSKQPPLLSFRAKRGICCPSSRTTLPPHAPLPLQRQQIPPGKKRPFGMTKFYGLRQRTAASPVTSLAKYLCKTPPKIVVIPTPEPSDPASLSFRRLSQATRRRCHSDTRAKRSRVFVIPTPEPSDPASLVIPTPEPSDPASLSFRRHPPPLTPMKPRS